MKIGITERGDAATDLSWYDKLQNGKYDGAVIITKNLNEVVREKILDLYNNKNFKSIIVHATCTGWGGTEIEPNVPKYKTQIKSLKSLIDDGFPIKNCVLRIDPIFPTEKGVNRVLDVIKCADGYNIAKNIRIRVSIFDEYKHVKERFKAIGRKPLYGDSMFASKKQIKLVSDALMNTHLTFETCAEPLLKNSCFEHTGCVSEKDLEVLGLPIEKQSINGQNRHGCLCLQCKSELLENKHRCPHNCLYCYWWD